MTGHKQTTDGNDYTTSYVYNLAGAMIEETYPSTRKVKNVLDSNGDLSMVQSKKNSNYGFWTYANSFTYDPAGSVTSMQLGNGKWESTTFNSRLQPIQIVLGTTPGTADKLDIDYTYGTTANNGNVSSQKITVVRSGQSDLVFDQTYTYDELNRLKIAEEKTGTTTNWKQTFTFDRYGNRRFDESNTTFPASFSNPNLTNPTFDTSNNRFASGQNWSYDAAGNITVDPDGRTFTYDAENKQIEVKNSSSAILGTYFFDGDGKRVKKVVPSTGEVTIFVYDAGAKLVAEYSTIVQAVNDAKVQYLTNDNLGTPRINTDANGNIVSRSDYMPYGEEIVGLGNRVSADKYIADDVRQGFTGYENDGETGLEYAQARMYKTALGRFTSVDSLMASADIVNPQSFNRYIYVGNNPVNITDFTGEIWGQLNGSIIWYENLAALNAARATLYTALVAQIAGTNQLVVLSATAYTYTEVSSAAEALKVIAAGGAAAAALEASAAALGMTAVAAAAVAALYVCSMDPSTCGRGATRSAGIPGTMSLQDSVSMQRYLYGKDAV